MPEKRGTARRPTRRRRWVLLAGGAVLLAALVTVALVVFAPGDGDRGPRPLTGDEANRLAITRFRNYEVEGRTLTITVPDPAGRLVITGSVDYRAGLGYGVVRGEGRNSSGDGLIEWSATTVLAHPVTPAPAQAPAAPPATGWYQRPLQTVGSTLDSALAITLGLSSDRPDNAQLLPQNGATWIGPDRVGGREVEVMAGPATRARPGTAGTVRYWLGQDGTMYRVEATVASEQEPVTVDFGAQDHVAVQPVPGFAPPR